jgi:preprotein translocase subunit SecE
VAESKRRGEDAVDEDLDEVLDDAVRNAKGSTRRRSSRRGQLDDEVEAEMVDEEFDDDLDDDVDSADTLLERGNGRGRRALTKAGKDKPAKPARVALDTDRVGIFGRFGRFVREVVAELRKVIWPTRKELVTYTAVVIVFVSIILTVVGLLDLGFAKAVLFVFSGK